MNAVADALAQHYGIQRKQALILAALYTANGAFIQSESLRRDCQIASIESLKVHVSWLRAAGVCLETQKGAGYRLFASEAGRCRDALRAQAVALSDAIAELGDAAA